MTRSKYPKQTPDNVVFIYRKDFKCLVFGATDASKYHEELIEDGYEHASTVLASVWIEKLIGSSHYDQAQMIYEIDK